MSRSGQQVRLRAPGGGGGADGGHWYWRIGCPSGWLDHVSDTDQLLVWQSGDDPPTIGEPHDAYAAVSGPVSPGLWVVHFTYGSFTDESVLLYGGNNAVVRVGPIHYSANCG